MPFVVDASVAASWLLPDEGNRLAALAYARLATDHVLAPGLWWFEMRNLFLMNERRGRITGEQTNRALGLLAALPIQLDHATEDARVMALARLHRLTVYDAACLELAQRSRTPLATLDSALANAAGAEGIALLGEETAG